MEQHLQPLSCFSFILRIRPGKHTMNINQILRWILIAFVLIIGLLLLNGLLGFLVNLVQIALPILVLLLIAAIILRIVGGGTRRTRY